MREVLSCKIHKATITEANVSYVGSITIDPLLLEKIDLWPGQKVLVVSNTSGSRLDTYVIKGNTPGNGEICINGAAAHLIKQGEEVIIIGFEFSDHPILEPKCILVDDKNQFVQYL